MDGDEAPEGPAKWRREKRHKSDARRVLSNLEADEQSLTPEHTSPSAGAGASSSSSAPAADSSTGFRIPRTATMDAPNWWNSLLRNMASTMEGSAEPQPFWSASLIGDADGPVFASYRPDYVMETLPFDLAGSRVAWWVAFANAIAQDSFRKGTFSSVSRVSRARAGLDDGFWQRLFPGVGAFPRALVVRRATNAHGQTRKPDALGEIFLACYCAFHGIAPRVFADFYHDQPLVERSAAAASGAVPQLGLVGLAPWERSRRGEPFTRHPHPSIEKDVRVPTVVIVSEAWSDDLFHTFPTQLGPGTPPEKRRLFANSFARKIVALFHKTASVGIFHGDIKTPNLLWRPHPTSGHFELGITDFDPSWCLWIEPAQRSPDMTRCMTVAMVALLMAYLRCWENDHWSALVAPVRAHLLALYPNCLSGDEAATCAFLQATIQMRGMLPDAPSTVDLNRNLRDIPDPSTLTQIAKRMSQTFQTMVGNYAAKSNNHSVSSTHPHCFKLVADEPLFKQLLDYCLAEVPPEVHDIVAKARRRPLAVSS